VIICVTCLSNCAIIVTCSIMSHTLLMSPVVSWMESASSEVKSIQSGLQSIMNMLKTVLDTQTMRVQVQ